MTPAQVVAAQMGAEDFRLMLDGHLQGSYGWVHSCPELFVCARPICLSGGTWDDFLNPYVHYPRESWEAWYIFWFAGNLPYLFKQVIPFDLAYVVFQRDTAGDGRPRWRIHNSKRLRRHGIKAESTEGTAASRSSADRDDDNRGQANPGAAARAPRRIRHRFPLRG